MGELKTQAWGAVNEALLLDSSGLNTEAYKKYLEGIRKLCIYLEEDYNFLDFATDQIARQKCNQVISVMTKSIDRLKQLTNSDEKPNNGNLHGAVESFQNPSSAIKLDLDSFNLNLETMPKTSSLSDNNQRSELSPLEKARRENSLIYRAYQARCQLVKDSRKRATLYLELHRKLTENIILARAKEAASRQKQIEKEKEILEVAAKKLDLKGGIPNEVTNNTEDWEKLLLYAQIIQFEGKEEWPNELRKKLREFPENENLFTEVIKTTLSSSSHPLSLWICKSQNQLLERIHFFIKQNETFLDKINLPDISIGDIIPAISSPSKSSMLEMDPNHFADSSQAAENYSELPSTFSAVKMSLSQMPLNKMWVEEDVLTLFDPLVGEKRVSKEPYSSFIDPEQEQFNSLRVRLNEIISDTCKAIEMLVQMMCATYELTDDNSQDKCYQMAENYLFRGVWPQLLQVFRIINYKSEKNMALVMEKLYSAPPEEVGIPPYFDLKSCEDEAVAGLQRLATLHTPLAKLHQLVKVAHIVCSEKTHQASGKPFGADDLIGVMCYLLVQTKMPHLVSEFEALQQLVPHRYLMGEEGYALTTHVTAMKYLESQLDTVASAHNSSNASSVEIL